ncbi:M15 family metallopeptidase [Isoptericola rhizosphaerae]|jgi:zinc D-Ala-D-Ala carboxypeptidase|uniref:M15 family metallopeptidase n=1 Tax=Isoptericola rhizosphaerae TaxID=3377837 RepID=UPI00383A12AD
MVAATAAFAITTGESRDAHADAFGQGPDARAQEASKGKPVAAAPPVVVDRSAKVSRAGERPKIKIEPAPEPEPTPPPQVEPDEAPQHDHGEPQNHDASGDAAMPPGCDVTVQQGLANGQVPVDQLCSPWDGAAQMRADAAQSLAQLNEAYLARFGEAMCISDGYRSYDQQVATKAAKGYLAATPGTSNHGWGLAVDLCAETYAGERWDWLAGQAQTSGWDNPDWARAGGSKYEPWHWEFVDAVAAQTP